MGESSPFAGTQLIRPLLAQTREALEAWARQHELCWIEDESNQDDTYDRNFLRLRVTPLLQQRWPHFAQAVARSAALCAEQESLLDELLASDLADCITSRGTLLLTPLMMMSGVRRAALLRRWLAGLNAPMPSRDGLERIWQEVALAREDASPCFRLGEYEVRRYQSQLWWVKSVDGQSETVISWSCRETPLTLPAGLGSVQLISAGELRMPQASEAISIRFKAPGVLHIVGRNGGRKLKKIWQEQGIPPWRRDTTPLLFYGETLIAAAGVFVTREGTAEGEEGVSLVWHA
jgi:tRNA(Ile)-lysidine synthase